MRDLRAIPTIANSGEAAEEIGAVRGDDQPVEVAMIGKLLTRRQLAR